METFSALLALCAGNSPVIGEFPAQRPVTRSFDIFFDLRLDKRLSKQSRGWWFETLPRPLWHHSNDFGRLSRNLLISYISHTFYYSFSHSKIISTYSKSCFDSWYWIPIYQDVFSSAYFNRGIDWFWYLHNYNHHIRMLYSHIQLNLFFMGL